MESYPRVPSPPYVGRGKRVKGETLQDVSVAAAMMRTEECFSATQDEEGERTADVRSNNQIE